MRILIAADSFKDALSAGAVCKSIARGLHAALPGAELIEFPLADGGEGTTEALAYHLGGQQVETTVQDPLGRPVRARYLKNQEKGFAYIEMAEAAGLDLLSSAERNPLPASTFGVGELILHAVREGAMHILLAIGGSATNDAGTGMAAALGFRFMDAGGNPLTPSGQNLILMHEMFPPESPLPPGLMVEVLCDVRNPLCGPDGAAFIYGPQKGANPGEVRFLDEGLKNIAGIFERYSGHAVAAVPGAGAAGGMGAGAIVFLNAVLKPGAETILGLCKFEDALKETDLLITGEGRLDDQTLNGKLIQILCNKAQNWNVPVIALCGAVEMKQENRNLLPGLAAAFSISQKPQSLEEALAKTGQNLETTAWNVGKLIGLG